MTQRQFGNRTGIQQPFDHYPDSPPLSYRRRRPGDNDWAARHYF